MSSNENARRPGASPFVAAGLVALGMVLLALAPAAWQEAAALRRDALAQGQWWRLWTAHLVHFGWPHLLWDGVPLAALIVLAAREGGGRLAVGALLCAPGIGAAVLWLQPAISEYRGASGLVVWCAAWLGVQAWRSGAVARSWLLGLAVAGLAKLVWDAGHTAGSMALPAGVVVAWSAHLAGALLGLAWGGAVRTARDR